MTVTSDSALAGALPPAAPDSPAGVVTGAGGATPQAADAAR